MPHRCNVISPYGLCPVLAEDAIQPLIVILNKRVTDGKYLFHHHFAVLSSKLLRSSFTAAHDYSSLPRAAS